MNNIKKTKTEESKKKKSNIFDFLIIIIAVAFSRLFGLLGTGIILLSYWLIIKIHKSNLSTGMKISLDLMICIWGILMYLIVITLLYNVTHE